ncbi:Ribosomal protein LP2 [Carabus blaptoides fortunei]
MIAFHVSCHPDLKNALPSPAAADIEKILGSVGIEADGEKLKKVIGELNGKSVDELISQGKEKLSSMPVGGGAAAPAAAAAGAPAAVEEKKGVVLHSDVALFDPPSLLIGYRHVGCSFLKNRHRTGPKFSFYTGVAF